MEKQGFELCPVMYFHVFFMFVYFHLLFTQCVGCRSWLVLLAQRLEMLQGNVGLPLDLPVLFKVYIQET